MGLGIMVQGDFLDGTFEQILEKRRWKT